MFREKYKKTTQLFFTIVALVTTICLSETGVFANGLETIDGDSANAPAATSPLFDFDGNGRTDWTVTTTPATAGQPITWKILANPASAAPNAAFIRTFNYGISGDTIIPRDFIGDGKTEPTVWRPGAQGTFYVAQFPNGNGGITLDRAVPFGTTGDNLSGSGDYDGDGKIDYTIVRVSGASLVFYIMSSATNTMRALTFGFPANAASYVVCNGADFAGDAKDELVVFTLDAASNETYYVNDAVTGAGVIVRQFGFYNTDYNISPADYTGDGKADFVVARENALGTPITWYINNSVTNAVTATAFGYSDPAFTNTDLPIRGDYDGDGRQDISVYRRSNNTFYVLSSQTGGIISQPWGAAGDLPIRYGVF